MRAIQIAEFGWPQVLMLTELPDPQPHDGFDVLDVRTVGINYADTYQVAGNYPIEQELPRKRDLAAELGADVTLDPAEPDLTAALVQANGGDGIDVVLEMAGGPVFDASLDALAHFGRLVTFGDASHKQPTPVDPAKLMQRSIAVIGFWFVHLMERPDLLREPLAELLDLVEQGRLRPVIGGHYPIEEARRAHEDLLSRATIGKLVLDA